MVLFYKHVYLECHSAICFLMALRSAMNPVVLKKKRLIYLLNFPGPILFLFPDMNDRPRHHYYAGVFMLIYVVEMEEYNSVK